MKKSSETYQFITKAIVALLLMAFLIPTGMQAKQLMVFCMMDMNHQAAISGETHSGHQESLPSAGDHCDSKAESKESGHTHNQCDLSLICACDIGESQLSDQKWIPTAKKFDIRLTRQNDLPPFYSTGIEPVADQQIRIGEYDPPLWLLYDTLLM